MKKRASDFHDTYDHWRENLTNRLMFLPALFQSLDWIHDTGEIYLSTHTEVGKNIEETQALLNEHNEFKNKAKVGLTLHYFFPVNPHVLCHLTKMFITAQKSHYPPGNHCASHL